MWCSSNYWYCKTLQWRDFTTCTLGEWVWKTKELLWHAIFTYLTTLSRFDSYIPRQCHTKILNNRCLNTRLIRNEIIFALRTQMALVKYESWGTNGKFQPCTVIAQIANQVVFHFRGCFVPELSMLRQY